LIIEEIRSALIEQSDKRYRKFHGALVPTQEPELLIGVRVPVMRKLAKTFASRQDIGVFLADLPHRYYEENAMHAFIIAEIKSFDRCIEETERFLPYINNWAVCDSFSPRVFAKNKPQLLEHCEMWLQSGDTYTVRFALVMLLRHFLEEPYASETLVLAALVDSEEYYVNMAVSWLFAEAMAKCPSHAQPYLEQHRLKRDVHNKAIQKSVESFRVSDETKQYLKTLKRKKEL